MINEKFEIWFGISDFHQKFMTEHLVVWFCFLCYKTDIENTTMFEISVLSCQHISISLEHPHLETMATIELDLTNMPNIKCSIFTLGENYSGITLGLSRILQTCASIPITVRTLLKYWEREQLNKVRGLDNSNLSLFCSQGVNISGKYYIDYSSFDGAI